MCIARCFFIVLLCYYYVRVISNSIARVHTPQGQRTKEPVLYVDELCVNVNYSRFMFMMMLMIKQQHARMKLKQSSHDEDDSQHSRTIVKKQRIKGKTTSLKTIRCIDGRLFYVS